MLKFPSAMLPCTMERNPERQRDQSQVQPEGLSLDIEEIVFKLVPAWNVPIGVHLRQPGEPRLNLMPLDITRNLLQRYRLEELFFLYPRILDGMSEPGNTELLGSHLNLLRQQRPRTDEAQLSFHDVPQLG